ncbi:31295_t:CDS:2 [Gigaspora margarita]|uniref:31295_t:CDS:1 n=1 Tax=Gigaspora margarita TaxID=4874 RepID=A0ABM8W2M3_GIGMA|nr:31295_t:CDS:2 [Gigaspora margarita]
MTANKSTKSDHKILLIKWNTGISLKLGHKKHSKRKIYLYDKVTADDWNKFSDDLIKKMDELQLYSPASKTKTTSTNIGTHGKIYCAQLSHFNEQNDIPDYKINHALHLRPHYQYVK